MPNTNKSFRPYKSYALLCISIVLTLIATYVIYTKLEFLFNWSLQQRALALVNTAALQFEPKELDLIIDAESAESEVYKKNVQKLINIKENNDNIKYAYIQRKTENPNILEFVADADALYPDNEIDLNQNGIIDPDEELSGPGEEYDISDYPDFINIAFNKAYVDGNPYLDEDDELSSDQWGIIFSATAPIRDDNGLARYLIGIDIDVRDFLSLTNIALVPFVLFVIFLLLVLIALTVILVRIWGSQLKILKEIDIQKDELLSIVSHQLATPVSSFKWYLEMLLDGDLGELSKEQKEHIKTMQSIGVNLSDLVSMILDVSRIQLGRMKVEKQSLDLNEFFKEIIEIIQPKAIQKNLNFKKKLPSKLPANAMLDRRYTHMTIENLLSNAVKYTPEKGTVTFNVEIKNNRMLCVVKDTGMGIPKSEQDKIFGRMFRASNVRNTVDGNGFGLFVAKGAVEAQGGKIWFESTEGKGTTFYVDLPLFEK